MPSSATAVDISPTFCPSSPNIPVQNPVLIAILCHKSVLIMKTLLVIQIIHLVLKAAEHLQSILHSIGHLVK